MDKTCDLVNYYIKLIKKNLGDYTCINYLGQGAFGTTFLVKDKKDNKIALKVIPIEHKSELETSILEKLSTSCSKRRVLCYFKSFESKNAQFIATEYIDGQNLKDYKIKNDMEKYKIIGQLIDAVEYIHSIGVFHFDIKPGNIMITKDGNVKLIDFGAAAEVSDKKHQITALTPAYAPRNVKKVQNSTEASYFDWYTVLVTIIVIAPSIAYQYYNYDNIPYDSSILKILSSIKKDIGYKITTSSKTVSKKTVDNFITNEYKKDVRKMFEEMKISKTVKKCPEGKILNPKTGRCVKKDGKIGKTLV